MSENGGQRLMTAEQLAERWQVPSSHVYAMARDGRLTPVRLGRYVRFAQAAVDEFERTGGVGCEMTGSTR